MEKCAALLNAQNVWAWASFFGHGSIIGLTKYELSVELTIHFPYDKFDKSREDEMVRNVVVAGAHIEWSDSPKYQVYLLSITWRFD